MKLIDTVSSLPVLGWVTNYTLKDTAVPVTDYAEFINNLATTGYSDNDLSSLHIEKRRPVDAQQATVKAFEAEYGTPRHNVRYLLRPDEHGNAWGARFLVKETFGVASDGKAITQHTTLGRIWLDNTAQTPIYVATAGCTDADAADIKGKFDWFCGRFCYEADHFPSYMLRTRLNRLLDDCLPVQMTADHHFSFVLRSNVKRLELLQEVITFLGGTEKPRSERSDITTIPIPDLAEMRDVVFKSFKDDMQEQVASLRNRVGAYVSGTEKRAQDMINCVQDASRAYETYEKYSAVLGALTDDTKAALDEINLQTQVVLGRQESRMLTLKHAYERLPVAQAEAIKAIVALPNADVQVRSDLRAATIRFKGGSAESDFVLTNLKSLDRITITVSSAVTPGVDISRWKIGLTGKTASFNQGEFTEKVLPWLASVAGICTATN